MISFRSCSAGHRARKNVLSEGREPAAESECLGAITTELATLVELDESEVEPRDEPAELDEDVGRLVADEAGDVRDGDVEHGEGLYGVERGGVSDLLSRTFFRFTVLGFRLSSDSDSSNSLARQTRTLTLILANPPKI